MSHLLLTATMLTATFISSAEPAKERTFAEDVAFLRSHKETIVLSSKDGQSQIAIVPAFQGRIMTSTAAGESGTSFGSINYDLIASGKLVPKINAFGGEDRFWMGPEGGQFAIFFDPGDKFTLDDWQTPACIDSDAYAIASQKPTSVSFRHEASLTNYSGHTLDVRIDRTVRLIDRSAAAAVLGDAIPHSAATPDPFVPIPVAVAVVAFESENTITNTGPKAWTRDTGLLSLWNLGMFKPSDQTVVIAPFRKGPAKELGPIVNDEYFGKVPAERVKVDEAAGVVYFRGDAKLRTKIGLSPARSTPVVGSWDPTRSVLTIVKYSLPADAAKLPYVNSMWEIQKDPFAGDVINSYNHGDVDAQGNPVNGFYELETSSPAAELAPGKSATHTHRTVHLVGPRDALDPIARKVLGVDLKAAEQALK